MTIETDGPADDTSDAAPGTDPTAGPDATAGSGSLRWTNVLIALTTVIAVLSVFSVWARTQVLDTDEWVNLSSELVADPEIQESLATFLVDQVYADGRVSGGLEELLPENLGGLSGPLAGALRGPLTDGVQQLLATDRFQGLWAATNRTAHANLVSVLRGENIAGLTTSGGEVALDLRPLVVAAAQSLGLPGDRIEGLAPDSGRIVIVESSELDMVQQMVSVMEPLAWILFVLVIALYVVAVFIARGRRMTALRNVGLSMVVVGVVVLAARSIAVNQIVRMLVDDASQRATTDRVLTIGTSLLRQQGWSAVIYGLLLVAFAALMGERRFAVAARRTVAPALNAGVAAVVGGVVVLLLLLIWWSPGRAFEGWFTSLLLVALVVGAVVTLRTRTLREFPDATFSDVVGRSPAPS